ncbi:MAG: N-acetyltransferase [Ferruginibacter sp.]|nr:N-acetyltransferase [Ferruginibacter sp.]
MEEVSIELLENGQQAFVIKEKEEKLAEMVMAVSGNTMTVYHTEVLPIAEGRGLGKLLLKAMADHARQNRLKVIPLCVFVQAQFKRHPELYADIWQKDTA